ncbi:hypothetical protein BGZ58_007081 [Dissophora ornata]|nr:hypothetical protein BGZ58_007081 [Dissophora ornata]
MSTKDARAAIKTVSAPVIEGHLKDLRRFCPTDNTCISMIVVYPAKVITKLRPRPDPKRDYLKVVRVMINESNINKTFPQSHVEFLDGIKNPSKRSAEDTQESEGSKKTKKWTP